MKKSGFDFNGIAMKKKMIILLSAFAAVCLDARQFGNFEIEGADLSLGLIPLRFTYFDGNWNVKFFSDCAAHAVGFPKAEGEKSYETEASVNIGGENAGTLDEKFFFETPNVCRFEARFKPSAGTKYGEISYSFNFPIKNSALRLDGNSINLWDSANLQKTFRAGKVSVETERGIAEFSGNLEVLVQDERRFNSQNFSLRFKPRDSSGVLEWDMKIFFEKVGGVAVPLAGSSDMGIPGLPAGRIKLGGIDFDFSRPAGAGLVVRGGMEKKLAAGGGGKHVYIIGAFDAKKTFSEGDCAEIGASYADGKIRTARVPCESFGALRNPADSGKPNAVWTSKIGAKTYNLFAAAADLGIPNPESITIKNLSKSDWKIAAISLCPLPVPAERLAGAFVAQSEEYAPFEPARSVLKGSALDFSGLLDAPAGKYGFAFAKGGEIFFEKRPDIPARFYGSNLCFQANYPDRENADRLADDFAATGYNILRLHHYDDLLIDKSSPDLLSFDAEKLDRLDYLVAAMKKRGIYVTTDLFVSRKLAADSVEPEFGWNGDMNATKAAFFVSPKAADNFRAFSKKLLEHVNPYTGLAWKDDPAVVSVSLVNENTIFGAYESLRPYFDGLFREWLAKNSIAADEKNFDFLRKRFLSDISRKFFAEQKAFLRSLGVRAMLTDQNFWDGYPVALLRKNYDIADSHMYFGHPHFIERPWQLPAKVKTESAISEYGGCIELSASQIAGKPFSITEWNYVNNNDHAAEGAFLMGAYGALHKWDMLCRFAYSHGAIDFSKHAGPIGHFDTNSNPVAALSDRAGALFFLRGDVGASKFSIPSLLPEDYLLRSEKLESRSPLLKRIGLYAATEIEFNPTPAGFKIPANAPFAVAAERAVVEQNKFDRPVLVDSAEFLPELQKLTAGKIDIENEVYESETSEMVLDKKRGTWRLVTPRSEAFISPEGGAFHGNFADIKNSRGWSCVLLASIDGKPLKDSSRILILHLSDVKNANMRFDDSEMTVLRDYGHLPLLARRAESLLTFADARAGWRLYALNHDGSRKCEVEMARKGGRACVKLSTVSGESVVFAYELARQ
ncbi:MAG: hypothetical protein DBX55_05325 [Verrucomicrobia bacterium]|nr:MAG: hypothetical protein DBX55_05325 [Verrucomicrobiota bacterium]